MEQSSVTLILGLAGISATLFASGLGHYFTAKARSSSLRQALFTKQLDLISRVLVTQGRIRTLATILTGKDDSFIDQARAEIDEAVKVLAEIEAEGAALLPTDLWIELKHFAGMVLDLLVEYDETDRIEESKFSRIVAASTKLALLCRAVIGVDELTEQSLVLFSSRKAYSRLTKTDLRYFEERHGEVNRHS